MPRRWTYRVAGVVVPEERWRASPPPLRRVAQKTQMLCVEDAC